VSKTTELAVATLVSWLLTEALGAAMLHSWIRGGGARQRSGQPRTASRPVLFGHAGLALSGFACWIGFLASGAPALAWLSLALLAPAIGLGISTLTVWTPFPRRPAEPAAEPRPGSVRIPDEVLVQALADEELTGMLIDDMLASMLAPPRQPPPRTWQFAPVIPIAHGILAMITFLLAVLAAVSSLR